MLVRIALLTLLLLTLAATTQAQPEAEALPGPDPEAGRPFITNFAPSDYEAGQQNWAVTQDEHGVLYVGNDSGVLEYDGATWRLIQLPNRSVARTLARDAGGRVWVGGVGEIGYLAPDSLGQMRFVSLREEVPEAHRDFADVWVTHATEEGVYFLTDGAVFRWDGEEMHVWPSETGFHVSTVVDGTFYVREWERGLMRMDETPAAYALRWVPGGERFAQTRIYSMLPYDAERMLVGTHEEGLFLYDGERFEPFETEADAILEEGGLYLPGAALPGGRFALGTISEGLVVIGRDGRLLRHIDRAAGLQDNAVYHTYEGKAGSLWLGLNNGIARVETGSPFTRYGAASGIKGTTMDLARHEGPLYAATLSSGLASLDTESSTFRPIQGSPTQNIELLSAQGDLLVAGGNDGVFRIREGRAEPVRASVAYDYPASSLHRWSKDSRVVIVGLLDGLAVLQHGAEDTERAGWTDLGRVPDVEMDVYSIAEARGGTLWLGTQSGRVARVRLPEPDAGRALDLSSAEVTRFGSEDGLPQGSLYPFRVGNEIYVTAPGEKVFRFDEAAARFRPDTTFDGARSGHSLAQFVLREDAEGRVWIASIFAAPVMAHPREGGGYSFERLRRFRQHRIRDIYPEDDGTAWLLGANEVIRYDTRREGAGDGAAHPPLVRRAVVGDSLLWGGSGEATQATVPHGAGELRFAYAAPGGAAPVRYRTQLEGFDAEWSDWTTATERTYTNLPPGGYRFLVEAEERGQAAYLLSVLPPWYRTWWAYLLYALAAVGLVAGAVHMRTQQLRARQRELEQTVEERTAELQQRVEELAVINGVQEGLVRELDMQAIYDLVGDRIRELFDAQVVVIRTYDHDAGMEHYRYVIEKGERMYAEPRPIDAFNHHQIEHREPILINEGFVDYIQQFSDRVTVEGEAPRSALFAPMIVGDTVRGNVSLQNVDREHAFTESDVRLLTTLANSMSVALENARLFAETRQQAAELETVNQISRALVAQLEFDALVHLVGEQMRETFQADIVYVALHDHDANMINFPYVYGEELAPIAFGEGLTSQIIQSREPLLVNQDLHGRHEELGIERVGKQAASYLGVPIQAGEEALGVISVQSTEEENRFAEDDLRLLSTIAANVGVALNNAEAYRTLEDTLSELQAMQAQLVQQEKMASLGQLTAGIAHEIKNPLNFVNNFAQLTTELVDELGEELGALNGSLSEETREEITFLLKDLRTNASKIEEHGRRADGIVKSMLQHSRGGKGEREPIEVNSFVDEYLNLSYHGMRASNTEFNSAIERDFDESAGEVEMLPQEIGRVLINLLNNAFYAVHERAQQEPDYQPEVRVATRHSADAVMIEVADNGAGIPEDVREKVFEPFFTTKPTGEGTGLGLSMSYDIVTQGHGGTMTVETAEGEGTTFRITLPATPTPAPEPAGSASDSLRSI